MDIAGVARRIPDAIAKVPCWGPFWDHTFCALVNDLRVCGRHARPYPSSNLALTCANVFAIYWGSSAPTIRTTTVEWSVSWPGPRIPKLLAVGLPGMLGHPMHNQDLVRGVECLQQFEVEPDFAEVLGAERLGLAVRVVHRLPLPHRGEGRALG